MFSFVYVEIWNGSKVFKIKCFLIRVGMIDDIFDGNNLIEK